MFNSLKNSTAHRAKQTGLNDQGDPTYGSPVKFSCRRQKIKAGEGQFGDAPTTQTVLTTDEIEFNDTDIVWFEEDNENNIPEGHVPDNVNWSETMGIRLSQAIF